VCVSMETGIGMDRARDKHRMDGVLLLQCYCIILLRERVRRERKNERVKG
jgi:hypothetical protein